MNCDFGYGYDDVADDEFQWPDVLRPEEVQNYLGIGKNTVYRLIQSGELKGFRVGKLWRIRLKDLEKFCNKYNH